VDNGRETVRQGLSGTGLRNTDDVATRQGHGPALGLNSSGRGETLSLDFVHDISGEAGFVERLNRLGHLSAGDGHLMLAAEGINLRRRASGHLRALLVEGLLELGHGREV